MGFICLAFVSAFLCLFDGSFLFDHAWDNRKFKLHSFSFKSWILCKSFLIKAWWLWKLRLNIFVLLFSKSLSLKNLIAPEKNLNIHVVRNYVWRTTLAHLWYSHTSNAIDFPYVPQFILVIKCFTRNVHHLYWLWATQWL